MNIGRKKQFSERLIHFTHALVGLNRAQTNAALVRAGFPRIPESSWNIVLKDYLPALKLDPGNVFRFAAHPPTRTRVREMTQGGEARRAA